MVVCFSLSSVDKSELFTFRRNWARLIRIRQHGMDPEQQMDSIEGEEILMEGRGIEFNLSGAPLLSPMPRNLRILWQEFQSGIGGQKPTKLFTHKELGWCKVQIHVSLQEGGVGSDSSNDSSWTHLRNSH